MPPESDTSKENSGRVGRSIFSTPALGLLVYVAAVLVSGVNFRLARNASSTQAKVDVSDVLRVNSRIWQDPDELIAPEKLRDAAFLSGLTSASEENWATLGKDFFDMTRDETNAILFVINHQSPYAYGQEVRLRTRVAVLAALRAAGLVKKGSDETLFVRLPEISMGSNAPLKSPTTLDNTNISANELMPCEMFVRDATVQYSSTAYPKVLVVWLSERDVKKRPWGCFYSILNKISQYSPDLQPNANIQVGILGPRTSDGLSALFGKDLLDIRTNASSNAAWTALSHMQIISTSATAADAFYHFLPGNTNPPIRPRSDAEAALHLTFTNASFTQFGGTDERLCFALASELALRDVYVTKDRILLLSEYDTFYGRSLPLTFKAVVGSLQKKGYFYAKHSSLALQSAVLTNRYSAEYIDLLRIFQDQLEHLKTNGTMVATNILYATYLAGLDGSKTVSDNPALSELPKQKTGTSDYSIDDPVGDQQLDYTKRLAYQLSVDIKGGLAVIPNDQEVKAVGLLGSDVFDKMLMLQALRTKFPHATFFTTGLDANYTMKSQTKWTRNLITSSGFGLMLQSTNLIEPLTFAPFRDTYQTAAYIGGLSFLTCNTNLPTEDISTYEIGRTRIHALARAEREPFDSFATSKIRLKELLRGVFDSPALIGGILISFFFIIATAFPARDTTEAHWVLVLTSIIAMAGIAAIAIGALFHDGLEPMDLADGVSVLPSVILGLMAVFLGGYGAYRTDKADTERSVSHGVGFPICITAMMALTLFVSYDQPCPMRSPARVWLHIGLGAAWTISSVLCVSSAFFWRSFLKDISKLLQGAEFLSRQIEGEAPGTKTTMASAGMTPPTRLKLFTKAVLFIVISALIEGFAIFIVFSALLEIPIENVTRAVWITAGSLFIICGSASCLLWIACWRKWKQPIPNKGQTNLQYFELLEKGAKLGCDVERFGPLSYYPMCTILLLVLASSSWLDAWHPTVWMFLLLLTEIAILMVLPILVCQKAAEFKRVLAHMLAFQRLKATTNAHAASFGAIKRQETELKRLDYGCFAPITDQPVLGAFATLIGGSGLVTLAQQFFYSG